MKLGTNKDNLPAFIEQQVKQSMPTSAQQSSSSSNQTSNSVNVNYEKYSLFIDL